MRIIIIMETWLGMKIIINTRNCEPETIAVTVIPAACWFASAGSACIVVPPLQADQPLLAREMAQEWPGGNPPKGQEVGTG